MTLENRCHIVLMLSSEISMNMNQRGRFRREFQLEIIVYLVCAHYLISIVMCDVIVVMAVPFASEVMAASMVLKKERVTSSN